MTLRWVLTGAVLAGAVLACLAHMDPCGAAACQPHVTPTSWPSGSLAGLGALVGVSLLGLAARAGWGAAHVQRRLPRLALVPNPPALRSAIRRTGVRPDAVRCLATGRPTAFCVGLFRPLDLREPRAAGAAPPP